MKPDDPELDVGVRNSDIGLQPGGYLCVVKST
jgi:hypothetical protein